MAGYKSHTSKDVKEAQKNGKKIWILDTGNDGEDDTLIGNYGDVLLGILSYHEIDELPSHWSLIEVDWEL